MFELSKVLFMPVLDDDGPPPGGGGKQADKKESEWDKYDPTGDIGFVGNTRSYNKDENPYERTAPPRSGVIGFKMFKDKEGWKKNKTTGDLAIGVDLRLDDFVTHPEDAGNYKGYQVEHGFSTQIYRGKSISTLAYLIGRFTKSAFNNISDRYLVEAFEKIIKGEPTIYGWFDWKGGFRRSEGKDGWVNLWNKMEEFPDDLNVKGQKQAVAIPWTEVVRGESKTYSINAIGRFTEIYGKREQIVLPGTKKIVNSVVQAPSTVTVAQTQVAPESKPIPQSQPQPQQQQLPSVVETDDLEL